jgi:hypothetical protein
MNKYLGLEVVRQFKVVCSNSIMRLLKSTELCLSLILAPGRLGQENYKFEISLDYIVRYCLKKKNSKTGLK